MQNYFPVYKIIKNKKAWHKNTQNKLAPSQITKAKQAKITQRQLAILHGVSERTIRNWKKPIKQVLKKRGKKSKISQQVRELLLSYLAENNTISQQNLANYLLKQTGCSVSQSTISRLLQRELITYKRTTPYFLEQRPLLGKIRQFINVVKLLPSQQLIFLDECSFYLNETYRYGYAPRGQRAFTCKLGNTAAYYNLILCLLNVQKQAVIHYQIIKGGVKAKKFHSFLSGINLPSSDKYYLLMDNLSVHKTEKAYQKRGLTTIQELLASKNITPLYLPPYTPQLNPVELGFNTIKHYYRKRQPKTEKELQLVIEQAIVWLQEEDLTKYFRH